MRQFTAKPKDNIDLQGRKIVSYIEVTINIVADSSIAATEYPQKFPGRRQLLKDVVDLLTSNGCQVLYSEESNRPESISLSTYYAFYYPLDDTHLVMVTVFLKVSDHSGDYINTVEYNNFKKKIENKYMHPSSHILQDPVIIMEPGLYNNYPKAMSDIEYELKDQMQYWKNSFKKKGYV